MDRILNGGRSQLKRPGAAEFFEISGELRHRREVAFQDTLCGIQRQNKPADKTTRALVFKEQAAAEFLRKQNG